MGPDRDVNSWRNCSIDCTCGSRHVSRCPLFAVPCPFCNVELKAAQAQHHICASFSRKSLKSCIAFDFSWLCEACPMPENDCPRLAQFREVWSELSFPSIQNQFKSGNHVNEVFPFLLPLLLTLPLHRIFFAFTHNPSLSKLSLDIFSALYLQTKKKILYVENFIYCCFQARGTFKPASSLISKRGKRLQSLVSSVCTKTSIAALPNL